MSRIEIADLKRMHEPYPRTPFDPQYYYLSKEDSVLIDELKDSTDEKDQTIVRLILDKANASYAAHCREPR